MGRRGGGDDDVCGELRVEEENLNDDV